jgi:hypothetical protein
MGQVRGAHLSKITKGGAAQVRGDAKGQLPPTGRWPIQAVLWLEWGCSHVGEKPGRDEMRPTPRPFPQPSTERIPPVVTNNLY